jgi:oligopeptidase B
MSKTNYDRYRVANWAEILKDSSKLDASIRAEIDDLNAETKTWFDTHIDPNLTEAIAKDIATFSIEESDSTPEPYNDGYWYFTRMVKGEDYSILCRFKDSKDNAKVLFDANKRAKDLKADFYSHDTYPSPDGKLLAIAEDVSGSEFYTIRFLDIATNTFLSDVIENTSGSMVWANTPNAPTVYFLEADEYHRPSKLKRHTLGTPLADIKTLYHNTKPEWDGAYLTASRSGKYISYSFGDFNSNQVYLFDATDPQAPIISGPDMQTGLQYDVCDAGTSTLYIRTNKDGASEYKVMQASPETWADASTWQELDIPEVAGRFIVDVEAAQDILLLHVREDCEDAALIHQLSGGETTEIDAFEVDEDFEDPMFELSPNLLSRFKNPIARITLSSLRRPKAVFDADLSDPTDPKIIRKSDDLKKMPADFDMEDYMVERHWAKGHDGVEVPITLLKPVDAEGPMPCMLYGYGSYGIPMEPRFSPKAMALAKQGMAFAIAHVRGGSDRNNQWYLDGKFEHKENTFKDFIACAEHLIKQNITTPKQLTAEGRSAGGLLMGAVNNMRPDLFAGIIAGVPFVDVSHTMDNADLPLTPGEYAEWGDPRNPTVHTRLKSFSPIDNITEKSYPNVYISGGLSDYRVTFWEPLIFALKLREHNAANTQILMNMNTGAGHFGASGRYGRYGEVAAEMSWALSATKQS